MQYEWTIATLRESAFNFAARPRNSIGNHHFFFALFIIPNNVGLNRIHPVTQQMISTGPTRVVARPLKYCKWPHRRTWMKSSWIVYSGYRYGLPCQVVQHYPWQLEVAGKMLTLEVHEVVRHCVQYY